MIFSSGQRDTPTEYRDRWQISILSVRHAHSFFFVAYVTHWLPSPLSPSLHTPSLIEDYTISLPSFLSFPRPCQLSLPSSSLTSVLLWVTHQSPSLMPSNTILNQLPTLAVQVQVPSTGTAPPQTLIPTAKEKRTSLKISGENKKL